MSTVPVRLIDPLPDDPGVAPGPASQFSDLVDTELADPDFQPGPIDDSLNAMADSLPPDAAAVSEVTDAAADAATSLGDTSGADPSAVQAAFDGTGQFVDTFSSAYRDLYQVQPLPPLSLNTTPDTVDDTLDPLAAAADTLTPYTPSGSLIVAADKSVTWSTQEATSARVYVVVNGGDRQLFASGTSGVQLADWLNEGSTYVFTLVDYSGGNDGATLAETSLDLTNGPLLGPGDLTSITSAPGNTLPPLQGRVRMPTGQLVIQPNNSVTWQSTDTTNARVYVKMDAFPENLFAEGRSGTANAPFIVTPHKYVFRLVDYSTGADGAQLASATLDLSALPINRNTQAPAPPSPGAGSGPSTAASGITAPAAPDNRAPVTAATVPGAPAPAAIQNQANFTTFAGVEQGSGPTVTLLSTEPGAGTPVAVGSTYVDANGQKWEVKATPEGAGYLDRA